MIEAWVVWVLLIVIVGLAAAFLWAIRLPTFVPEKEKEEDSIVVVQEDEVEPVLHLHDAARQIRANEFGGTVEDTLNIDYVRQLDDILTEEALKNGEKLYLDWLMAKPEQVAHISDFVEADHWDLVEAMLGEDVKDAIDVGQIIIFLKARKEDK